MVSGYNEFPNDVQYVFADVISKYNFQLALIEPDAVALVNDIVQIGFSINEDILNMTIKSSDKFYNVTDIIPMIDKTFYIHWRSELESSLKNIGRKEYYKTYLIFYHQLSDKFLLNTYVTGIIPSQKDYDKMREVRNEKDRRFSIAWKAMQLLDYSNPIRKKYIANDETWIEDMMKLINEKDNLS